MTDKERDYYTRKEKETGHCFFYNETLRFKFLKNQV